MSVKVDDISCYLEKLAPLSLAEQWDNVGLIVGDKNAIVNKVLVTLDISWNTVHEAINKNVDLIISHHPLIFEKLNKITVDCPTTNKVIELIKNNISVYSAHTNLDIARGGVCDILANRLELSNIVNLCERESEGLGRIGELNTEMTLVDFAKLVGDRLSLDVVRYVGNADIKVKRVAVLGGSGAKKSYFIQAKQKDCDVYVTGDLGHHGAAEASEIELPVIDGTHYATEIIVVEEICNYLREGFKNIEILQTVGNNRFINELQLKN